MQRAEDFLNSNENRHVKNHEREQCNEQLLVGIEY
jgi:hypothetical protein